MEADLKSESGRASRYLAVRYTGKGLNWSTTLALVWWLGEIWMWYIFAVTILIEYCFDFWTQKLWAFRDPREGLRVLLMQFRFYLLVRASIAALTGAVVYLILTRSTNRPCRSTRVRNAHRLAAFFRHLSQALLRRRME